MPAGQRIDPTPEDLGDSQLPEVPNIPPLPKRYKGAAREGKSTREKNLF